MSCEHDWLKEYIKDVPDFPSPGINFKDIVPLLADKKAYQYSVQKLSEAAWQMNAEVIVAIESRGFIFAAPVAFSLGVPFVPIRKKGKLPGKTIRMEYSLEYGIGELEIPQNGINRDANVVIIDDVLATGGTARAAKGLITALEAKVAGYLFLIELDYLKGKIHLGETPSKSLVTYF